MNDTNRPDDVVVGSIWRGMGGPLKIIAVDGDDALFCELVDPADCCWETREDIARVFDRIGGARPLTDVELTVADMELKARNGGTAP